MVDPDLIRRKLADLDQYVRQLSEYRTCGFRNLIVHDYARLDPVKVIRMLREGPPDLERFRIAALEWV